MPNQVRAALSHSDADHTTTAKPVTFPAATAGTTLVVFSFSPAIVTPPAGWAKHGVASVDAFEVAVHTLTATGGETGGTFNLSGARALGAVSFEFGGLGDILYAVTHEEPADTAPTLDPITTTTGQDVALVGGVVVFIPAHAVTWGAWTGGYVEQATGIAQPSSTEDMQWVAAARDGDAPGVYGGAVVASEAVNWQSLHVAFQDLNGLPAVAGSGAATRSRSAARAGRSPLRAYGLRS